MTSQLLIAVRQVPATSQNTLPRASTELKPAKINLSAPRADDESDSSHSWIKGEFVKKQALAKTEDNGCNNKSHQTKSTKQKLRIHEDLAGGSHIWQNQFFQNVIQIQLLQSDS